MKQIKYILLATLLSIVLSNNGYSQRYWNPKSYPVYPLAEEWIIAVNGGLSASNHISWGVGGNISKKLNPYWTIRAEAFIHNVHNDAYTVGKCALAGMGVNFSISETFSGYSRNRVYDLYLTSCIGMVLDRNNDIVGNFGYYANLGIGAYTRIAKNVYFNVENKVFCMTNLSNIGFHNYTSIGVVFRINSHTRPRW